MKCPACDMQVEDQKVFCPCCGWEFKPGIGDLSPEEKALYDERLSIVRKNWGHFKNIASSSRKPVGLLQKNLVGQPLNRKEYTGRFYSAVISMPVRTMPLRRLWIWLKGLEPSSLSSMICSPVTAIPDRSLPLMEKPGALKKCTTN